jgi:ArsR family transcriptional regulator
MRICAYINLERDVWELIKVFRALSDETRMRMLHLLLDGELCVCEIMQALEISQTRASRNLGMLRDAGLLKDRRDGQWVHYSLDQEAAARYSELLELLRSRQGEDEVIAEDKERLRRVVKMGKQARGNK